MKSNGVNLAIRYVKEAYQADRKMLECAMQSGTDEELRDIFVDEHLAMIASRILLVLFNEQLIPKSYQQQRRYRDRVRLYKNAIHLAYDTYCIEEVYEQWVRRMHAEGFTDEVLPEIEIVRNDVLAQFADIELVLFRAKNCFTKKT